MNEIEQYVRAVMRDIHAPATERERIESDLRAHLQDAVNLGEPAGVVIARMGSPAEVASEFMSEVPLHYASFWARLAAFAIDWALITAATAVFAVIVLLVANWVPRNPVGLDWIWGAFLIALIVSSSLAILGIQLLYFMILEGRFGQTIGKRVLGLWVLKENRLPIGYKEAFLRRLSYYFRFLPFDALFIPFTEKHQRAFDIVARTIVVRDPV